MQDNDELNAKPRILTEKLFLILKWLFVFILGVILVRTFQQKHQNLEDLLSEFSKIFIPKNAIKLISVISLIFVNWACEARKWQILTHKFEVITFIDAFKSVLVGLTLGFITPANLGDFAGRIIHLKKTNRPEAVGTVLLGNGIQFYVTLIFGIFSYLIIWSENILIFDKIVFGILIFCSVLGVLLFLYKHELHFFFKQFKWLSSNEKYSKALTQFDNHTFRKGLIWTTLRFITYSLQFVIMLQIFQVDMKFIDLWAVSCLMLLFKTLIPQLNFLGDLGIRQLSALHFFSFFSVNNSSVITATFALWIINILLPVILGSMFFLRIKSLSKTS